ncbi:MAG: hypothetical protein KGL51_16315 [Betaproteobacteria bacterium]|nr:hypothetical protein [Betaproteobacteria bacterium]MDE2124125.1 hypothetical protein [Betaproteobacteria bacterium]MDE2186332.1 hypothetical protein [Betaproteobacteria bacterium]MDE2326201.1 hypothetical protein [Betaproteobacteria bacterium]
MMKRWPRLFLLVAVWVTCLVPVASHDIALAQTCPAHKIVIPFINGVFVTINGAKSDLFILKSAVCANPSDTTMCQNGDFERLYNESGLNNLPADQGTLQSALSLVTGAFQDIIETLWQIAHQNARTSPNWFDYLLYIFMHPVSANVISLMASQEAYAAAHPPTQADVASMETAMDGWYAAGDDILLTAYSQGNLFAYPVFNDFVAKHGINDIAFYGIAPPSSQVPGEYTLNSDDLVIKLASVADATLNPGNPPPTPNASQLCTAYVAPTNLTNIDADVGCLADHGLNYYLDNSLGTSITGFLYDYYISLKASSQPHGPITYTITDYGPAIYIPTNFNSLIDEEVYLENAAKNYTHSIESSYHLPLNDPVFTGPWLGNYTPGGNFVIGRDYTIVSVNENFVAQDYADYYCPNSTGVFGMQVYDPNDMPITLPPRCKSVIACH